KAAASSCNGIRPAARRIAVRSQRTPKTRSEMPTASCSQRIGKRSSSGPATTTMSASSASAAAAPSDATRQPRTAAAASTIVNASTASTSEARNAADTAAAAPSGSTLICSSIGAQRLSQLQKQRRSGEQAQGLGVRDRLRTPLHAELGEDALEVRFHRLRRDAEDVAHF